MVTKIQTQEKAEEMWTGEDFSGIRLIFHADEIKEASERGGWDVVRKYIKETEADLGIEFYYYCAEEPAGTCSKRLYFLVDKCYEKYINNLGTVLIHVSPLRAKRLENPPNAIWEDVVGCSFSPVAAPVSCPLF